MASRARKGVACPPRPPPFPALCTLAILLRVLPTRVEGNVSADGVTYTLSVASGSGTGAAGSAAGSAALRSGVDVSRMPGLERRPGRLAAGGSPFPGRFSIADPLSCSCTLVSACEALCAEHRSVHTCVTSPASKGWKRTWSLEVGNKAVWA